MRYLFLFSIILLLEQCAPKTSATKISTKVEPTDSHLVYTGRFLKTDPTGFLCSYPGSEIAFEYEGAACEVFLEQAPGAWGHNYALVVVDNETPYKEKVDGTTKSFKISPRSSGKHKVSIVKITESNQGKFLFKGLQLEGKLVMPSSGNNRLIEFIGNSITCGYGIEGESHECKFSPETENAYYSYAAVASRKLNAHYHAIAYSGKGMYRNYDRTTKETMSLIYDRYFPDESEHTWDFKTAPLPQVVVLSLGTNDFSQLPSPDSIVFVNTYVNFLKRLRYYYPEAWIICMEGPMTSDSYPAGVNALTKVTSYIKASVGVFERKGEKKMLLYFPPLQKAGELGCDWHPNLKKHAAMGNELAELIKSKLSW
ncbi:MAG: GDSL-type esterase/lipase family protein [Cytophagaceae bacterium]|jgi:lysophospholipase L1-like esterase|nr:GDSL-type esterase/lipase family protein [Cytophagaceae bacterium]